MFVKLKSSLLIEIFKAFIVKPLKHIVNFLVA